MAKWSGRMGKVYVAPRWGWLSVNAEKYRNPAGLPNVVDTTSNAQTDWQRDLSPFYLGPCLLYGGHTARNVENAWQYAKVYWEFLAKGGGPNKEYWRWARAGWDNPKAVRYPMGKGRKPEYSFWSCGKLDYLSARKVIYGPLYAEAVQKTAGWTRLQDLARRPENLVLLDYDGYDHRAVGYSLKQVLNDPRRKMGHAFVLAMLLRRDHALKEMELRR